MFAKTTRILVADDMKTMRFIVKKSLMELGFNNFVEAEDGAKAWNHIQNALKAGLPIDLIVSDWMMPNMRGIELLAKVRDNPETKYIPFILLTAENEITQIKEAATLKVNAYIVKPFSTQTLGEKLKLAYANSR